MLLSQAFQKKFIIPEFEAFVSKINEIYTKVHAEQKGHVSLPVSVC